MGAPGRYCIPVPPKGSTGISARAATADFKGDVTSPLTRTKGTVCVGAPSCDPSSEAAVGNSFNDLDELLFVEKI